MFDDGRILRGYFTVENPEGPLKKTNFERITESPVKLAEFLGGFMSCNVCPVREHREKCLKGCDAAILEWLQEECE